VADRDKECTGADGRKFKLGKTCTKPRKAARGSITLTPAVLVKHFRATGAEHVVGIHTTGPENVSKFGVVEIDSHGGEGNDPEANRRAMLGWYDKAVGQGFHPLLWDSDQKGGFHLDLLLGEPVATPNLFWYLREFVQDYAAHGLPAQPETFPKQPRVNPDPTGKGHYGNWCRLIGRHHTRDVWATVWNGSDWLAGEAAVAHVLSLNGDPASLIPADTEVRCRVGEYRRKLPNLGDRQGRDDVAYNFLAFLVRDLALPDHDALRYAGEWDADNRPPKGPDRLAEILVNVHEYGQRGYGSGLNGDGHGANGTADPPTAAGVLDVLRRRQAMLDAAAGKPAADAPPEHTDTGNAAEFAKDHAEDVRWTLSHGWLVWDGKRWKVDDTLAVVERGKATAARMMTDAAEAYKAASAELAEATEVDDKEAEAKAQVKLRRAKLALANAKYCRQKKGLDAMLALARSIPGIAVTFDQFDTAHHLFNVDNGTIDLKTGTIRPHRKEDQLTRLSPVTFDRTAEAPVFDRYLCSTFNQSAELIDWLKVYFGSCLTGETRDELLVVFWGSGSNGKSKLIELLLWLMGDHAWKAPAEILLARRQDPHPEERASLCGRRFVACAETDQGRRLNEGLVKELTGSDSITARFMHKNSFTFRPTWKLVLATNYRPQIRGQDHGIWRRVKLVPFTQRFWKPDEAPGLPELKADLSLGDKLKGEYPGVLAWMVRGAVEWYATGLPKCKTVDEATQTYRQAEDTVQQFVDQRVEYRPKAETKGSLFYAAFKNWHDAEGLPGQPMTGTAFGTRFSEIVKAHDGVTKDDKRSVYKGVALAAA
jgi:P4 family phage/plasmid primase-like protien